MKIDAEKLSKAIEAMDSVCSDGKKDIRNMLSEGFGVKFKDNKQWPMVKSKDILYHSPSACYYATVVMGYESKTAVLVSINEAGRYWSFPIDVSGGSISLQEFMKHNEKPYEWEVVTDKVKIEVVRK